MRWATFRKRGNYNWASNSLVNFGFKNQPFQMHKVFLGSLLHPRKNKYYFVQETKCVLPVCWAQCGFCFCPPLYLVCSSIFCNAFQYFNHSSTPLQSCMFNPVTWRDFIALIQVQWCHAVLQQEEQNKSVLKWRWRWLSFECWILKEQFNILENIPIFWLTQI